VSPEDAEEYTQALGQVVAGGWRQVALGRRLGVPEALGLTTAEWVQDRLGGYVRLSIPERREAVAELTEEGLSTREAAEVLGVGKSTVADDRVQERTGDGPEPAGEATEADPDVRDRTPEPDPEPEPDPAAKRVEAWARKIRAAIETLGRMAGYPVPDEVTAHLDPEEVEALAALLEAHPRRFQHA